MRARGRGLGGPLGPDYKNATQLRAEYIVLRNTGPHAKKLKGWVVKDAARVQASQRARRSSRMPPGLEGMALRNEERR
jgi:hypothetical protein